MTVKITNFMKMKKISKIALLSAFLMVSLTFLTGCSKVSLTGTNTGGQSGTPTDGGTPPPSN